MQHMTVGPRFHEFRVLYLGRARLWGRSLNLNHNDLWAPAILRQLQDIEVRPSVIFRETLFMGHD